VSDSYLPCHALTVPFFSRPRHSTAVESRPVGYLPAFGFFRLPRGVPRKLLSETYQLSSQRSIRHGKMEEYLHPFLTSAIDGVVSSTPRPLHPSGRSRYPLNRKASGPQNWSLRFGEEVSILPLRVIEPGSLGHPSCSLVTNTY